jgi:WD40 repeat protein
MLKAVIAIDTLTSADSRVMLVGKNAEVIWTQVLGTKVVPNYETGGTEMVESAPVPHTIYPDAIVIVIDFLCSCLRNVLRPSTKILAVSIVLSYISYLSDDIKLHRVLPYFISLLMDQQERSKVKIATLKAVKSVLLSIKQLSSNDLLIFDEYIWPSVSTLRHDENSVVQAAFADHLADFAEIGRVFLELERHLQKEHSDRASSFDTQIEEVRKSIMSTFKELYSKDNVMVHKALTNKLGDLCVFFGKKLTSNHVLPLIIPWLSRIWDRRILTLDQIPKVVQVIGYSALTGYIYPCMEDGLKDKEEHIVYATLKAFRLIDVPVTPSEVQMFAKSCHLLLHPNQWIKDEMVLFIKKMIDKMDIAENYLRIRPVLQGFLSLQSDLLFTVSYDIVQTHIVKSFRRKTYEALLAGQDLGQLLPYEEAYLQLVSDHIRLTISSEDFGRSVIRSDRPETLKQYSLDDGNELELAIFHKVAPNLMEAKSMIEGSKIATDAKPTFTGKLVENIYAKSSIDSPFEGFCPRGRLICCVNEHESAVTSLAVSEDSSVFLSASKDSTVRIWTMKNLQK